MLQDFLKANRTVLIERCHTLAAIRAGRSTLYRESRYGIRTFLEQLIKTLTDDEAVKPDKSAIPTLPAYSIVHSELQDAATLHGRELLEQGFTLEQVVRDYGDVCQAVTTLAVETKLPIAACEFRTFNRCLDNAIAAAVGEYVDRKANFAIEGDSRATHARLAKLVHELQKNLREASLQTENVGRPKAAENEIDRSLAKMRSLTDLALAEVRVSTGAKARLRPLNLVTLLGRIIAAAAADAIAHRGPFAVTVPDNDLLINADPELLSSVITQLLHHVFAVKKCDAGVRLQAHLVSSRILIEVAEEIGGPLPAAAIPLAVQWYRAPRADGSWTPVFRFVDGGWNSIMAF